MQMNHPKLFLLVVVLAGCGNKESPAAKSQDQKGIAVTPSGPPPLSPMIRAARCGEPCLFLTETPLEKLVEVYRTECAGMETKDVGFGDCSKMDYVRNCVYAAHGLVYKKKRWKKVFEAKPWYQPNPTVLAKSALGPLELANIRELNLRGKACKKGMSISGADFARVSAWFKSLDKAPMLPKILYTHRGQVGRDEFVDELRSELQREGDTSKSIDLSKLGGFMAAEMS
jgi:hypothetical protein